MSMREAFHIPEDDLIQYALGTLKETQLSQFTAHVSLCSVCRADLAKLQVDLAAYATVQPVSELPAGAKDRFMARVSSDAAGESKFVQMRNKNRVYTTTKSFQHWLETPMPLKILSGLLAAALIFMVYDDVSHIHQLRKQLVSMRRLELDSAQLAELKNFLHGTNAQQVTLREKPPLTKVPEGHTLYSPTSGELVFTASNLPLPPAGKVYELWIIPATGGAAIPAGVFTPDLQGNAAVVFPEIPAHVQAQAFGVTVEEAEGASTPTLPIILSGGQ
jgi:hypothetical protein